MKKEIVPNQIWKSNYADIFYKTFGGSTNDVEMFNVEDVWDCVVIRKKELKKHFTLQNDLQS